MEQGTELSGGWDILWWITLFNLTKIFLEEKEEDGILQALDSQWKIDLL